MKSKTVLKLVKGAVFVLIFCALFLGVQKVFTNPGRVNYQLEAGFAAEPENTLDAVYIGGSNAFTYWEGPLAWDQYGIAVQTFASDGQSLDAREYFLSYAIKKQPDALFIITVQDYVRPWENAAIHWSVDYFPESIEKYKLIKSLTDLAGFSFSEKLSFYFPLIQYHSRWTELTAADFHYELDGLKGGFASYYSLKVARDVTESFHAPAERGELPEEKRAFWENFLNYCDSTGVSILFVIPPMCNTEELGRELNTVKDMIEYRGYPVLDLVEKAGEIGLDFTTDYYNEGHTNIHGAIKVTDYVARYLVDHYGFEDKRGAARYASWDAAYEAYLALIREHLTAEELERVS